MPIKLSKSSYGKAAVRVMKVTKHQDYHEIKEIDVETLFEGDFEKAHTTGDNSQVLPTDTQKNTIFALAKKHPIDSIENYGLALAKHFLDGNPQIDHVTINLSQKQWTRIPLADGNLHPHAYQRGGNEKWTARIEMNRKDTHVFAGLGDLLILKTTDSGFSNFKRDQYTTLKDTDDRVFATSLTTEWAYSSLEVDYALARDLIQQTLLTTFANHKSLSVQHTLYDMGKSVLEVLPAVSNIDLDMPNKHHILVNLDVFDLANENEVFVVTDDPFGVIKGSLSRS